MLRGWKLLSFCWLQFCTSGNCQRTSDLTCTRMPPKLNVSFIQEALNIMQTSAIFMDNFNFYLKWTKITAEIKYLIFHLMKKLGRSQSWQNPSSLLHWGLMYIWIDLLTEGIVTRQLNFIHVLDSVYSPFPHYGQP